VEVASLASSISRLAARAKHSADLVVDSLRAPTPLALHSALAACARARGAAPPRAAPGSTMRPFQAAAAALLEPGARARVAVAPSSLGAGSGRGVFAAEPLEPGDAITLYPGAIYTRATAPAPDGAAFLDAPAAPVAAPAAINAAHLLAPPEGSAYVAVRWDGVMVDALRVARAAAHAALARARGLRAELCAGHVVQHPPARAAPNCASVPVDFFLVEGHEGGLVARAARGARAGARGAAERGAEPGAAGGDAELAARMAPFFARGYGDAPGAQHEDALLLPWRLHGRLPYWHAETAAPLSGALPPLPPALLGAGVGAGARLRRALAVPALLLVAVRSVARGEELFQDYALWPDEPGGWPQWYSRVSVERRWEVLRGVQAAAAAAAAAASG